MRYFLCLFNDEFRELSGHTGGELVNRRPMAGGFYQLKHKRQSARKSAWNKKAIALVKRMGL